MKNSLLITIFSFLTFFLYAQNGKKYIAVSKITLEEAISFNVNSDFEWDFEDKRMEFYPNNVSLDSIWLEKPNGNYLYFIPKKENIEIKLKSIIPFSVHINEQGNKNHLIVLNQKNEIIENANVEVDEEKKVYNKKEKAFVWKKEEDGSFFSVEVDGIIGFFDEDSYFEKSRKRIYLWKRIKRNRVGYMFVTAPKIWCAEQIDKLRERWV